MHGSRTLTRDGGAATVARFSTGALCASRAPFASGASFAGLAVGLFGLVSAARAQSGEPEARDAQHHESFEAAPTLSADDARTAVSRAAKFLQKSQNADGSWASGAMESVLEAEFSVESFYDWQMATVGLASMALMVLDENPEREGCLEKALSWLCTSRLPKRGNHWDIDGNWTSLYGYVALTQAACDARFQSGAWRSKIEKRALEFYRQLEAVQTPEGGWGYYEGPVISARPTWSTSFSTACAVPALVDGLAHGWPVDPKLVARATEYVRRCRLPNGAYEYDLRAIPRVNGGEHINDVKGSLGRIQVCNWALRRAGEKTVTDEKIRSGLEAFFTDHKFLDFARMRPIPHEGYYYNAGYFYFFGHYHAAMAINELPENEREAWHARLRPHLVKAQWADGSSMDFQGSSYLMYASTSFAILALEAGLHPERFARPAPLAAVASKPAEHATEKSAQKSSANATDSRAEKKPAPAADSPGVAPKR
jgi:hypothetical protein